MTAIFAASVTLPGPRPHTLLLLLLPTHTWCPQSVTAQAETIARHEKEILATGEDAVELVRGLESRMKAAIADLRTEVLQKMSVITNEITQLQKVVNVMKGESNILAQQSKDANRRIQSISAQISELSMELLGEPTGATDSS